MAAINLFKQWKDGARGCASDFSLAIFNQNDETQIKKAKSKC